jgi:hypothetical protein
LLTRAVDEDVAIIPDEELVFMVKPKNPPHNLLPVNDYSTALKISAHGVSVCAPDRNGVEKEHFFWVYTDFYKWSLVSQTNKLALLVNVFADASFSRRDEYTFRNKEASRLASAIEFFIEKFMSAMHYRLETMDGVSFEKENKNAINGMHAGASSDWDATAPVPEMDLLNMDSTTTTTNDAFGSSDPFGDGFGDSNTTSDAFGNDDTFGSSDAFGSSDPFGFTPPAPPVEKIAPELTQAHNKQHAAWFKSVFSSKGGPIYDDGTLQIAIKIEVRGSQGRLLFFYRNQTPENIKEFAVNVEDASGLIRFQLSPVTADITGSSQGQFQLMIECMKPSSPGPIISIAYNHESIGNRKNSISLPIAVTTFNDALAIQGKDFWAKWQSLTAPGQEVQKVINPSSPIIASQIHNALATSLQFSRVSGMPDESEFVIYGASSLRTGATNPAGEKINYGCLIKIEMNVQSNALRLTTRTSHASASAAIIATALILLN